MATIGEASVKIIGDLAPLLKAFNDAKKATLAFDQQMSKSSAKTAKFFKSFEGKKLKIDATAITRMNQRLDATQRRLDKLSNTTVAPKVNLPKITIPQVSSSDNIDTAKKKVDGLNASTSALGINLGRVAAIAGTYLGTKEIIAYADSWTQMGNQLAAASQIAGIQARSLQDLNKLANESRSTIEATASLYARLLRSTVGVAESEEQIAKATDAVNKAFKAGGAATSEQAAGIMQLGQALGSGFLQGDELRSIRENAPLVAQAIADEFNTTIAGLKDLGAEGKLTSERVFQALLNAHEQINATFATTNSTIADSFSRVNNAITEYVGNADKANGVTTTLVGLLNWLADNFGKAADIASKFVAVIAGAMLGRSIANMVKSFGSAVININKFATSLRTATAVAGTSTISFKALGAAINPLAAVITGIASVAAFTYITSVNEAAAETEAWKEQLFELGLISEETAGKIEKAAQAQKDFSEGERFRQIEQNKNKIRELNKELIQLQITSDRASSAFNFFGDVNDKEAYSQISKLIQSFRDGQLPADEMLKKLREISNTKISQSVEDYLIQLRSAVDLLQAANQHQDMLGYNPALEEAQKHLDQYLKSLDFLQAQELFTEEQANELRKAATQLAETGEGADELRQLMDNLGKNQPKLEGWFNGLNLLIDKLGVAWQEAARLQGIMGSASQNIRGIDPHDSRFRETDKTNEYLSSQREILSLSERELKLRQATTKELDAAAKAGVTLTKEQARRLAEEKEAQRERFAEERKAARGSRKNDSGGRGSQQRLNEFDREKRSIEERIALMEAERAVLETFNPALEDYGYSLARAETAQNLLSDAKRAGLEISKTEITLQQLLAGEFDSLTGKAKEQAEAILELANAYAESKAKSAELNESVEDLKNNFQTIKEAERDAMSGFVSDMVKGKSAVESLNNALGKLADALLDVGLNLLFGSKGSSGFGALGSLFGFASGGYTGDGGKYEPKGIVHGGEYVMSKEATKAIGVSNLEALHRSAKKGYASGGYVGKSIAVPNSSVTRQSGSLNGSAQRVKVSVDVSTSVDQNGNLESFVRDVSYDVSAEVTQNGISQYNNSLPDRMQDIQNNPRKRTRQ